MLFQQSPNPVLLALVAITQAFSQTGHAADADLLISAEQLSARATDANPATRILDVRDSDAFEAGHIPGAAWIDTNRWRKKTFEKTGLTDSSFWSHELSQLGIERENTIVVVGDSLPESARVWWLLRYFGLPKVQLLDGGQAAWVAADLPLSQATTELPPTEIKVEFQTDRLATLAELQAKPEQSRILDNRSQAEFSGSRGVGTRTGHIPGSLHIEWKQFLDDQGRFLSADQIRELLVSQQVNPQASMITLCQTGGRSSVAAFALELAGVPRVKNYYRGWGEYAEVLTAPVEKSPVEKPAADKPKEDAP